MAKNYKQEEAFELRTWLRKEDQRAIEEQLSDEDVRYPAGVSKPDNAMRRH